MKAVLIILLLLSFQACSFNVASPIADPDRTLRVSFLNVGQGDATLITCPDSTTKILIDAGNTDENYQGARDLFLKEFRARMGSAKRVNLAINTHPHPDHLAGFAALLDEGYIFEKFVDTGIDDPDSVLEETLREKLADLNVPYEKIEPTQVMVIELCAGVKLRILPVVPGSQFNLNDSSLVVQLEYQSIKFLLTGDIHFRREEQLLNLLSPKLLESQVLKVGHHGSNYSTSPEFLAAVEPDYAVVSVGEVAQSRTPAFMYPGKQALAKLNAHFENPNCSKSKTVLAFDGTWQEFPYCEQIMFTNVQGSIDFSVVNGKLLWR